MRLLTKPYGYQTKGITRLGVLLKKGGALLADDPGLGKSLQTIGHFVASHKKYPGRPMLVACPASLRLNWQNEFRTHLNIHAAILEGHAADPDFLPAQVYIIGYDTLGDSRRKTSWAYHLKKRRPYLMVMDESHLLKNRDARRTKYVAALARKIPQRIGLSGTPLVNRPAELWTILNICRPDLYPNFMAFAMRHCRPERKPWGWEYKGADNLDELHHDLLMNMMVRRLKADVLKDLPAKSRHVVPLPLNKGRKEYDDAHHDFLSWMRKNYRSKLGGAKKAEVLVKTGYLLRLAAKLKLPAVIEWISLWLEDNDGKMLVFGHHTDILEAIHAKFGRASVLVTGKVPMAKRKEMQAAFQQLPRVRLFVGNADAAGAGWNGTAGSAVAFAEYDWRPGIHRQAEDRMHRIGKTGSSDCFYLTANNTIEEKLARCIQEKQQVLDAVLDGGDVPDTLSVFDQLMETLED